MKKKIDQLKYELNLLNLSKEDLTGVIIRLEELESETKTYTEEDLRLAFRTGATEYSTSFTNLHSFLKNGREEDKYIESLNPQPKEEKNIPITFFQIKNNIGWSKWCDVTGGNHYALNEGYSPSDSEVFYCTRSQAIELGIIKD